MCDVTFFLCAVHTHLSTFFYSSFPLLIGDDNNNDDDDDDDDDDENCACVCLLI